MTRRTLIEELQVGQSLFTQDYGYFYDTDEAPNWDDLDPINLLNSRPGGSAPLYNAVVGSIQGPAFRVGDSVSGWTEYKHGVKEGSPIMIHLHWITGAQDATNRGVQWTVEWTKANGGVFPVAGGAFASSSSKSIDVTIPANTPAKTHVITAIDTLDATGLLIGAYIGASCTRIASGGSAPSANPWGLAIGFHARHNTRGSRTVYAK